jgi:hypothetical protein
MSDKDILNLVSRIGSNAYDATDLGNGFADLEVTAAQASKLQETLGKDHTEFVAFDGAHVIIRVSLSVLKDKAETNQRVSRGSSVNVEIVSRIVYTVNAPDAANEVTRAWWEAEAKEGGISVNGEEYPIFAGIAADYYEAPEAEEDAKNWDPERTVYVVQLPTAEGVLTLTSYGVTNLIRRVASRDEKIG